MPLEVARSFVGSVTGRYSMFTVRVMILKVVNGFRTVFTLLHVELTGLDLHLLCIIWKSTILQ